MELDLGQVRAFVVTAGHLHFGRAAGELFLTQQALSKRVARLEESLGVRLFDRTGHAVRLTPAGERFLEPARRALAAADAAVAAARGERRPLRLDVWGHLFDPMRILREAVDRRPDLPIELNLRRGPDPAVAALRAGEADAGFGRVSGPPPDGLAARVVRREPMAAVMGAAHPLAGAGRLRPADLRATTMWFPAAIEKLDFLRDFCAEHGLTGEFGGVNLGLPYFLERLRDRPDRVSLLPAALPVPGDAGVRVVPLVDPVPLYEWSLLWRSGDRNPALGGLLAELQRAPRAGDRPE
ncbi:LysR family transcriptional regulator [Actinomadura kijaniata]|uniref:LysR family transcriptional regulator n=1 Tax=Actinomadura kijaniata TaxID=46161 RepID=UPI003F1D0122